MSKNILIVLVIVIVIIIAGIIVFSFLQRERISPEEAISEEDLSKEITESLKEVFSLSAVVLRVDSENNFLMVKPKDQETEIKVILSEGTKIKKLGIPSKPEKTTEKGRIFTPTETYIEISDITEGDKIFITTNINIAGKTEFNDVTMIQVYP